MTVKNTFTDRYGGSIQKMTIELKQEKKSAKKAKTKINFLQRCIKDHIIRII